MISAAQYFQQGMLAKEGLDFINNADIKQLNSLLTLKKVRSLLPCRDNYKKHLIKVGIVGGILLLAVALTVILAVTCHVEEAL